MAEKKRPAKATRQAGLADRGRPLSIRYSGSSTLALPESRRRLFAFAIYCNCAFNFRTGVRIQLTHRFLPSNRQHNHTDLRSLGVHFQRRLRDALRLWRAIRAMLTRMLLAQSLAIFVPKILGFVDECVALFAKIGHNITRTFTANHDNLRRGLCSR